MKWIGATLVFLAEMAMLAAFAWWGFDHFDGAAQWLLGIGVPAVVVTGWGLTLSPRAPYKPQAWIGTTLRLLLLLAGAGAFLAVGASWLGMAQAAAAIFGTAMARGFEQGQIP